MELNNTTVFLAVVLFVLLCREDLYCGNRNSYRNKTKNNVYFKYEKVINR